MVRSKVKLAFVMKNSARKATYNRRKRCLLKKVSELSTLCGIPACAIIFSPYNSQPEVWPNISGVQNVIAQYNKTCEMGRAKEILNQETFLKRRIAMLNKQLKRKEVAHREKMINLLMFEGLLTGKERLESILLPDLIDLGMVINQKLKKINERLEAIKNMAPQSQATPPLPSPPMPPLTQRVMPVISNPTQHNRIHFQVQEQDQLQWYWDIINHPIENMAFGIEREH